MVLWHAENVGRTDISHHELLGSATIVVGQGLAGTAVAWELHRRGQKFVVVDPEGLPIADAFVNVDVQNDNWDEGFQTYVGRSSSATRCHAPTESSDGEAALG